MAPSSHCGSPIVLRDTCGLHAVTAPRPSRGGDRTKRRLAHDPWISFKLQPTRITRLVNRLNCYRGTRHQSARTCHGYMGLLSHRTSKPTRATLPMQRQVRSGGPLPAHMAHAQQKALLGLALPYKYRHGGIAPVASRHWRLSFHIHNTPSNFISSQPQSKSPSLADLWIYDQPPPLFCLHRRLANHQQVRGIIDSRDTTPNIIGR